MLLSAPRKNDLIPVNMTESLRLERLSYHYGDSTSPASILSDVSLCIGQGETCAITGPSGSGKSTLMNLIGLLEQPKAGKIFIAGMETTSATPNERSVLRNVHIGFIFQSFNLLPRLTALENVALPLMYRGVCRKEAAKRALEQLELVGLTERSHHRPHQLSGGQCQRVAIARALSGDPALLLADEPTGNLDSETGEIIINLLLNLNTLRNTTLIIVTHDGLLASRMSREFHVANSRVHET